MSPSPDSPTPSEIPPPPAAHALQFDKAEEPTRSCAFCAVSLSGAYFQVAGADACPACAEKVRNGQDRPGWGVLTKAILFGLVAMVVCAAAYGAFTMITGMEFGIVAIFVGIVMGRAIRAGTNGLGGRRCQWIALVLTYFAITFGSAPSMYQGLTELRHQAEAEARKTGTKMEAADPMVRGIVALVLSPAVPFFAFSDNLLQAILGVVIIAIGLHQAWKSTARDAREVVGPLGGSPVLAPSE